jgi:hypothetical protein
MQSKRPTKRRRIASILPPEQGLLAIPKDQLLEIFDFVLFDDPESLLALCSTSKYALQLCENPARGVRERFPEVFAKIPERVPITYILAARQLRKYKDVQKCLLFGWLSLAFRYSRGDMGHFSTLQYDKISRNDLLLWASTTPYTLLRSDVFYKMWLLRRPPYNQKMPYFWSQLSRWDRKAPERSRRFMMNPNFYREVDTLEARGGFPLYGNHGVPPEYVMDVARITFGSVPWLPENLLEDKAEASKYLRSGEFRRHIENYLNEDMRTFLAANSKLIVHRTCTDENFFDYFQTDLYALVTGRYVAIFGIVRVKEENISKYGIDYWESLL